MKLLQLFLLCIVVSSTTPFHFDYLAAVDKYFEGLDMFEPLIYWRYTERDALEWCRQQKSPFCKASCQLLEFGLIECYDKDKVEGQCRLVPAPPRSRITTLTAVSEQDDRPAPPSKIEEYSFGRDPPPKTIGEIASIIFETVEKRLANCTLKEKIALHPRIMFKCSYWDDNAKHEAIQFMKCLKHAWEPCRKDKSLTSLNKSQGLAETESGDTLPC